MKNLIKCGVYGDHFCGNKISEYGLRYNRVDYATLAKAFDAVLNNTIYSAGWDIGYGWEQVSGYIDNTDEIEELQNKMDDLQEQLKTVSDNYDNNKIVIGDGTIEELQDAIEETQTMIYDLQSEMEELPDIYQWYIVDNSGADILQDINEIVLYHEELDMYLWGVTHFGTSWDYVLTAIPCNTGII